MDETREATRQVAQGVESRRTAGPSKITVLLEALLEGLEVLDCPTLAEAVIVCTNIVKLAETIDKDLYVKSTLRTLMAQRIHVWLEEMGKK